MNIFSYDNFKRLYLLIAVVPALFFACGQPKDGFENTPDGLKYRFIKSSKGTKPSLGDILIMHINYRTEGDSVIFDSRQKGDSFTVVLVKPTFQGGVEEGFAMMSPGDSAIFKTSADSLFEKTFQSSLPSYLKPGSAITFQVKLKSIIPKSFHDSLESARDIEMRRAEFERIELFLKQNNMDVMPTENGVYMVVSKPGTGDYPLKGDTVFVAYTGRLLHGTIFDQSVDAAKPFSFVLGTNMVIAGWEDCFPLMNKGTVARMVVPSDLGYGAKDYGKLPGYSTLVFDVEVLDIKSGKKDSKAIN